MLVLVLPVAAVGAAFWLTPFIVTRKVTRRFRPQLDQVATYTLSIAFLVFPLWLGFVGAGVWLRLGGRPTLATLVFFPLAGLAAVAWRDRQAMVLEDARVFLRARRRSESRDRLAEQRRRLVAEFDSVAEAWRTRSGE